jgi:YD repeat-containing protein
MMFINHDLLLSYGTTTFGYTANGSLTWKAVNGDTTRYNYDNLGNLILVILPNGDHIEYIIDGQNRRIGKKVNGKFLIGWLYQDQLNPFAEIDSNGVITSQFICGDKWHVPSQMIKNGITYRIISDHLGNVREIINQNSGEIIQKIKYDEFGNIIKNSNPYFQPFTFGLAHRK